MAIDASRPHCGEVPDEWLPAIERFEEFLEKGETPDLSVCLHSFTGDVEPLIAELIATYQSFRAVHPRPGNGLGEFIEVNPRWHAAISQAIGELSTHQIGQMPKKSSSDSQLPRRLGRYLLVELLGKGGFSEVFLGCVPNSAEFIVAKLARKDIPRSDLAREALRQEKNALLQLRGQPGVTKFLDWHEDGEETVALVTEFVQARPLNRVYESEEVSAARLVTWMTSLCDILQTAHRAGVNHCDIKPHNVLIDELHDKPLLIDFGLSQTLLRWTREPAGPAAPVGTLHYLAPELLQGASRAEPRLVDMFGMGALLYYLMTGTAPFRAANEAQARDRVSRYDIDFDLLDTSPFSQDMKDICRRAIAKRPIDRFQSPQALRAALLSAQLKAPLPTKRSFKTAKFLVAAAMIFGVIASVYTKLDFGKSVQPSTPSEKSAEILPTSPVAAAPQPALEKESANGIALTEMLSDDSESKFANFLEDLPQYSLPEENPSNKPLVEHRVAKITPANSIDIGGITRSDIQLTVASARRDLRPWGSVDLPYQGQGTLLIRLRKPFQNKSLPALYRIGQDEWRAFQRNEQGYYAILLPYELDSADAVEIAFGSNSDHFLAGPFGYQVNLRSETTDDEKKFIQQLIQEARAAEWLESHAGQWSINEQFAARYECVIREFRFGPSLSSAMIPVPKILAEPMRPLPFNHAQPHGVQLFHSFASASSSIHQSPVLWTEIDFVDGSYSGPRQHHRPKTSDSNDAKQARWQLILQTPDELAKLEGFEFTPLGLGKFAHLLSSIEFGPTAVYLPISVPVVVDSPAARLDLLLSQDRPFFHAGASIDERTAYRIPAAYFRGESSLAPICVPPLWPEVHFRVHFKDGSPSKTFRIANKFVASGFEPECIKAEGCPKAKAYAYAFFAEKSDPERSIYKHLTLPTNASPALIADLHRIQLHVFVDNPPNAAYFEHFADAALTQSRSTTSPGLHYTRLLDRYGRSQGVCTYRIDQQAAQIAADEFLVRLVEIIKRQSNDGWKAVPN